MLWDKVIAFSQFMLYFLNIFLQLPIFNSSSLSIYNLNVKIIELFDWLGIVASWFNKSLTDAKIKLITKIFFQTQERG